MRKSKAQQRIVSKKAYVAEISSKTTLASFGLGVFLFGVFCALVTLVFIIAMLFSPSLSMLPICLMMIAMFGGGSAYLLYFGRRVVREAKEIQVGVPLTRANIGNLPVGESLVRASSEPAQEQQATLLRAAMSVDTTPAEQLARAYQPPVQEEQAAFMETVHPTLPAAVGAEAEFVQQRAG